MLDVSGGLDVDGGAASPSSTAYALDRPLGVDRLPSGDETTAEQRSRCSGVAQWSQSGQKQTFVSTVDTLRTSASSPIRASLICLKCIFSAVRPVAWSRFSQRRQYSKNVSHNQWLIRNNESAHAQFPASPVPLRRMHGVAVHLPDWRNGWLPEWTRQSSDRGCSIHTSGSRITRLDKPWIQGRSHRSNPGMESQGTRRDRRRRYCESPESPGFIRRGSNAFRSSRVETAAVMQSGLGTK